MEPWYDLARLVAIPPFKLWFDWRFEDLDRIPRTGPAIVAANHISYLDPFANAYAVVKAGRRPRFLAKDDLFKVPVVGTRAPRRTSDPGRPRLGRRGAEEGLNVSPTGNSSWTTPTESASVRLRTRWASDDVAVLAVAGELDNAEAAAVGSALDDLLRSPRSALVVLDLSEVTFFGSRGLAVVVNGARTARSAGTELRGATGPDNRRVIRPLDITGVDQSIAWFPTAELALAGWAAAAVEGG